MTADLGQPDIIGQRGRAWAARLTPEIKVQWPAGLDTYLLHRPGAHPCWSWYVVTGCSLRDVPGVAPAPKHGPDMTHELIVFALDPAWTPGPDWCSPGDGRWAKHWLKPANLICQGVAESDEQWCSMIRVLTEAFCRGDVSPEANRALLLEFIQREMSAQKVAS